MKDPRTVRTIKPNQSNNRAESIDDTIQSPTLWPTTTRLLSCSCKWYSRLVHLQYSVPFFITLMDVVGFFDLFWPYTWWFLQVMSARHTHICRCSPHRSWIVTDINRKSVWLQSFSPCIPTPIRQGKSFVTVFLLLVFPHSFVITCKTLLPHIYHGTPTGPGFVSSLTADHHLPINLNQYQWIVVVILSFPRIIVL